jgi:Protein of unknown function (DUF3263)
MLLSDRDRDMLDFERGWWLLPMAKGPAIRARFGLSPSRYYQLLAELIDSPEAAAHDPLVVHRLRRARSLRRRARVTGRTTSGHVR